MEPGSKLVLEHKQVLELHSKQEQVLEPVLDSKQELELEQGSKQEQEPVLGQGSKQELEQGSKQVLVLERGSMELELELGQDSMELVQELGSTSVHASSSSKKTISCEVACSKRELEPGKLAGSSEQLSDSL